MLEKLFAPRNQVIILSALGFFTLLFHLLLVWPSNFQVRDKQEAFITALEEGDHSTIDDLISEHYRDQWEFDKDDAILSLKDVRSRLMSLSLKWKPSSEQIESPVATLEGTLTAEAVGLYFPAHEITDRINGLEAPFVFRWEKESWIPWSWRLVRIENSDLSLDGYSPGAIKRAFGG